MVDFHKTRPGHDRHYGLDGKKLENLKQAATKVQEKMKLIKKGKK